jgi:hypothetical protein
LISMRVGMGSDVTHCQWIASTTERNDVGREDRIPFISGNDSTAVPTPRPYGQLRTSHRIIP